MYTFKVHTFQIGNPDILDILTLSFLGSLSRSILVTVSLTLRDKDRAIKPPVLMSFSLRSIRTSLVLSAKNSARATAPESAIQKYC